MKNFLRIAALLTLFAFPAGAEAATCFWVGGTATWDNTNTGGGGVGGIKWASGTGGVVTCAGSGTGGSPATGDTATFDVNSGGGTVTVSSSISTLSLLAVSAGAFTGTIDWSGITANWTLTSTGNAILFSGAVGTGRVFNLGNGTFTISNGGTYDFSALGGAGTQVLNSATIVIASTSNPAQTLFAGGGLTYGTVTVNARTTGQGVAITGNNTYTTLNINGTSFASLAGGSTHTITNLNVAGSSSAYAFFGAPLTTTSTATLTVTNASISRAVLRNVAMSGSKTATDSIDLGGNTGFSAITPPTGGSGGRIIGG